MVNSCVTANKNDKNEKKSNSRNNIYEDSSELYQIAFSLFENVKRSYSLTYTRTHLLKKKSKTVHRQAVKNLTK